MAIDETTSTYDERGTRCRQCRTWHHFYGIVPTWTFYNGEGPFCDKCVQKGVTITVASVAPEVSSEKEDAQ